MYPPCWCRPETSPVGPSAGPQPRPSTASGPHHPAASSPRLVPAGARVRPGRQVLPVPVRSRLEAAAAAVAAQRAAAVEPAGEVRVRVPEDGRERLGPGPVDARRRADDGEEGVARARGAVGVALDPAPDLARARQLRSTTAAKPTLPLCVCVCVCVCMLCVCVLCVLLCHTRAPVHGGAVGVRENTSPHHTQGTHVFRGVCCRFHRPPGGCSWRCRCRPRWR